MSFELFDAEVGGSSVSPALMFNGAGGNPPPVVVEQGLFTVLLDFEVAPYVDNASLWLEISVSGTPLIPRQHLTPAPFSLATRGLHVDAAGNVGIGTDQPEAALHVSGNIRGQQRVAFGNNAYFGLGGGPYPGFDRIHDFSDRISDFTSSTDWSPMLSVFTLDPLHDMSNVQIYANSFESHSAETCDRDIPFVNGLFASSIHRGSATMVNSLGGFIYSGIEGNGHVTYNSGLAVSAGGGWNSLGSITENRGVTIQTGHWGDAGDVQTNYGLFVSRPTDTQTINANYGIYIEDQNVGQATNFSIYSESGDVYFNGDLDVTGSVSKGGGSFKIDHPLDPANKYLYHSFVESPDMMNIYNGNIITDAQGYATIQLPEWFETLNRDFRYLLTVIDDADSKDFVLAKVVQRIQSNKFRIRTSKGNIQVSWQVTGVRQDAWAEAHRIPVEQRKVGIEAGRYLHPEAYGLEPEFSIRAARQSLRAVAETGHAAIGPGK